MHDLKDPASIIAGYAELLETGFLGDLTDAQLQAMSQLRLATDHLLELVDDINDSFRLRSEGRCLQREELSPARVLWAAIAGHHLSKNDGPRLRYPDGLPDVLADPRLIHRVMRNLIANAYKHAGPHAQVVLSAGASRGCVYFMVEDDGVGILAEHREAVFQPFFTGNGTRQGSGLGLAFCKVVVEQHGGSIWADDSSLGGTRITFALPVVNRLEQAPLPLIPEVSNRAVR